MTMAFATQKADRELSRSNSHTVFCTFDLQKTLPLPTNVAFYLRQGWLYNLGVHSEAAGLIKALGHVILLLVRSLFTL